MLAIKKFQKGIESEKMSWWLMLASGPDSAHRLHRGEACTQTLTGVIVSVQSTLAATFAPEVMQV